MRWFLISIGFMILACKQPATELTTIQPKKQAVIADSAMVVSARAEASKIGLDILKQGGNAFDAMVATEMALALTYPNAGNLGGGGFMVYRTAYGEMGAFDYREKAPMAAYRDMYLDAEGNVDSKKSLVGGLAVGVPGTVAGMFAAHQKLGTLPLESLLQPVIDLARSGYVITAYDAAVWAKYSSVIEEVNGESSIYTIAYQEGDTIRNPALANTLERIAQNGISEFYEGKTADILVNFLQSKGGIITREDMSAYEPVLRDPIVFSYKDLKLISMSPPSSGGVALAQIMKGLESYDLSAMGFHSVQTIHLIAEAERRAYADRSYFLGDPDFVDIPVDSLISEEYNSNRMSDFDPNQSTPSATVEYGSIEGFEIGELESTETTHYSIVDAYGNAIAATTTLNASFGSKLYCKELGFFLNNEMDDFSAKPGQPNLYGLVGGTQNAIAPQKRMLSSMTPTLIEKDGQFWMSVGTPGGSTIITSVLQTILNVYEFDMDMQEAIDAPRFHHQWLPDAIQMERNQFSDSLMAKLKKMGHEIRFKDADDIGKVNGIRILENGKLEGGADRRADNTALGY